MLSGFTTASTSVTAMSRTFWQSEACVVRHPDGSNQQARRSWQDAASGASEQLIEIIASQR
jgi:hypothetical protein